MPAPPIPAMALPMISAVLLGAAPHITLPTSKRMIERRYTSLMGQYL